jgi:hypothetical protein
MPSSRPGSVVAAFCLAVHAIEPTTTRWEVSVGGQVGAPSAWVKVGENDVAGMRLHFRQDLGVAASEAFDVKAPFRQADLRTFFLAVDISRGFSFGEWISTEGGQPAQRKRRRGADEVHADVDLGAT